MSGLIRSFAAIPMPEEVTEPLEVIQDDLPVGRPVLPENMHLTLVFLGDLRGPDLEEVHHAFEAVRAPEFELQINGLGQFGQRAPRAVYAAVAETRELRHLQAKLEQAARNVGVELPNRRFVPHVTLARLKGRAEDAEKIGNFVARRSMVAPPPVRVEAFGLYRSHLSREDPIYEELASYPLGAGGEG